MAAKVTYNQLLPMLFATTVAGNTAFIRGHAGIGKSQMIKDIAKMFKEKLELDEDVEIVTLFGSVLKEGECGGIPVPVKDPKRGIMVNDYTTHVKIQQLLDNDDAGKISILFIDEFNRANNEVEQELMQLVLDRQINAIKIPDSVAIICAGNPVDDMDNDYQVHQMNAALINRFVIFDLISSTEDWLSWAISKRTDEENYIDEDIIEFIASFPQFLHMPEIKEEIKPTPRGWEIFSKSIKQLKIYFQNDKDLENMIFVTGSGIVGNDAAKFFSNFLTDKSNPIIKAKDLYDVDQDTFKTNLDKLSSDSFSRMFMTMDSVYTYIDKNIDTFKKNGENVDRTNLIFASLPKDFLVGTVTEMKNIYPNIYKVFTTNKNLNKDINFVDILLNTFMISNSI